MRPQSDRIYAPLRRLARALWLCLGLAFAAGTGWGGDLGSASAAVPVFSQDTQPAAAWNMVDDTVVFFAGFGPTPAAAFQWQKISDGTTNDIAGATNTQLTLTHLRLSDAGDYRLKAVNATNAQIIAYTSARPLTVTRVPASVDNVITLAAAQTGLSRQAFTPTWTVDTNANLIAGQSPASSSGHFAEEVAIRNVRALTAGGSLELVPTAATLGSVMGYLSASANYVTCGSGNRAGSSLTYVLAGAKDGYDLTGITVYGGWVDGGRDQQAYTVYYSTVESPELFCRLGEVNFNPTDSADIPSATRVMLCPAAGVLARNVAAVKFDFTSPESEHGYCGYAQIVLSGIASEAIFPPAVPVGAGLAVETNRDKGNVMNRLDLLGAWMWDAKTFDGQTCQFWRAFDLPANGVITRARLIMTADNEFSVFVDGHELGRGSEWQELFDYNLLPLQLAPGRHVVAIKAFNFARLAGVILGLRIELADGRFVELKSDAAWRVVPDVGKSWETQLAAPANWPATVVVAPIGTAPWWEEPAYVNVLQTRPPDRVFFWQAAWFQISFLTLSGLLLLLTFALVAQLALHQKERWLLQRERARIAMDIHDDIGSRITQLVLNGEDAQEALPKNSPARQALGEIWDDARKVLSSLDEILWALNPRLDTLRDFADYICDYAHKFLEPAGIECVFEVDPSMRLAAADMPLRRSLLMAIKETLNNTAKHSKATELRLKIERQRQTLLVVVQDNGCGFDPAAATPGRNGLENLARRMRELGGTCTIASQPGAGCRVEFRIPLTRPRRLTWFKKRP